MKKYLSITPEGKLDLQKELEELKARRPEITERIATARSYGDLSENEDYSAARGEQKVVEGRILEIEDILKNSQVLRAGRRTTVALGATVTISMGGSKTQTFRLVSPIEANPLEGKISDESPIGKSLLGQKVGDTGKLPNGKKYEVISIS